MPLPLRRALLLVVPAAVLGALLPASAAVPGVRLSLAANAAFTGVETVLSANTTTALGGSAFQLVVTPSGTPEQEPLPMGTTPEPGQYTTTLGRGASGAQFTGSLDLRDPSTGTPAAPGLYDAAVLEDGEVAAACTGCFTVLTRSAPAVTALAPRRMVRGETRTLLAHGRSFADGTLVEVLPPPKALPLVTVTGSGDLSHGPDTDTRLVREVQVDPTAPLGFSDVRVTNTDGRTSTCPKCFTVTAPADKVEPTGATNDSKRLVRVSVPEEVPATARLRLLWTGAGAPAPGLDLTAATTTVTTGVPSTLTGLVDFAGATPGLNSYEAGYVLPDGSVHGCDGLCRFTVRQGEPPLVTALKGLYKVKTAKRTVTFTGTGFTRGTLVTSSDEHVVVERTTYSSPTSLTIVVAVDPEATGDPVTFTVANPDDQSSTFTSDPMEPGPPAPPVPAVQDGDGDPDPSRAPEAPSLALSTAVSSLQQTVHLRGRAEPGTALDLFTTTAPATTPVLVRSITITQDSGAFSFVVTPSASTRYRVVSRNSYGRAPSEEVGLRVRAAVLLAAPVRVRAAGPARHALRGSVRPARANRVVNVYEVTGRPRLVGTARTRPDGSWSLQTTRLRPGTTVRLRASSRADVVHASGSSPVLPLGRVP